MPAQNAITFTVWENDPTLEIQLEPEARVFTLRPNEEMTFTVLDAKGDFSWAVRHCPHGIQLFPETSASYERIDVYKNGLLSNEPH